MIVFFDKKQRGSKVAKSLLKYSLFLLIINLAIVWSMIKKTEPTKAQKFNVFVSAKINNNLKEDLRNNLDDSIYEINVYDFSFEDQYFSSYYTLYGPGESDLIIAPKLNDLDITNNYCILPSSYNEGLKINDKVYALPIYNHINQDGLFAKYLKTPQSNDLYVYIPTSSFHYSNSSNKAIEVIERIFYETNL